MLKTTCVMGFAAGLFACGSSGGAPDASPDVTDASEAGITTCDPTKPFSAPVQFDSESEYGGSFSQDELTFYFLEGQGQFVGYNAYYATRATTQDAFGPKQAITSFATIGAGKVDTLAPRGNDTLYISVEGTGFGTDFDIWEVDRPFTSPTKLPASVNGNSLKKLLVRWDDGEQTLYFQRADGINWPVNYRSTWNGSSFDPATAVTDPALDGVAIVGFTADALTVYFIDSTPTFRYATRVSLADSFTTAVDVPGFDMTALTPTWISGDGCRLIVSTGAPGSTHTTALMQRQ